MPASQTPLLPTGLDGPRYEQLRRDPTVWFRAIEHIAASHGLSGSIAPFTTGTAIVFSVAEWVIKLYPPLFAEDAPKELLVLHAIDSRLGIPTPSVRASGKLEGFPYLIMRKLNGEPLDALWPSLNAEQRLSLAQQLGRMERALHAVDVSRSEPYCRLVRMAKRDANARGGAPPARASRRLVGRASAHLTIARSRA